MFVVGKEYQQRRVGTPTRAEKGFIENIKPIGHIKFRCIKSCIIAFAQQKQTSVYFFIWLISNELKKYTLV